MLLHENACENVLLSKLHVLSPLCAWYADGHGGLANGFRSYLASGIHIVLGLDCLDDLRRGNAELGKFIRIYPYAQRILTTEHLHAPNSLHASDLVLKVDDCVVGHKVLGELVSGRVDCYNHERRGDSLVDR